MKIYCQCCNKKTENAGRGLCQRCYQTAWKEGKLKDYHLEDAFAVEKEQTAEQAQPESKVEPQSDFQPENNTQKEDPLADAELLDCRNARSIDQPIAKISKCGQKLYFNYAAIRDFEIHHYSYVQFFRKNGEVLLRFLEQSEGNSLKLTIKNNKDYSVKTISISIRSVSHYLIWQPKQTLQVKETPRPDVIKLVENDQ